MNDKHISYYIKEYVEYIKKDFYNYIETTPVDHLPTANLERMKQRFEKSLKIDRTSSKKYTKIITLNKLFRIPIVHSFILNYDCDRFGKDFKEGDILLPEFHRQPYYDKTYGNVILKNYVANWHRPLDPPSHL